MVDTIGLRSASPGRPRDRTLDAARALLELRSARHLPRALRAVAGGTRFSRSRPPAAQHRSPLARRNRPPARLFSQARPGHRRHGASLLPGGVYHGSHRRRLLRQPVHRQPPPANGVEKTGPNPQQGGCLMSERDGMTARVDHHQPRVARPVLSGRATDPAATGPGKAGPATPSVGWHGRSSARPGHTFGGVARPVFRPARPHLRWGGTGFQPVADRQDACRTQSEDTSRPRGIVSGGPGRERRM